MSQEQVSQNYNDPLVRSQMFGKNAVGLSESEDSMYARRRDSTIKDVNFTQVSNHSYEVVQGQYLVPKDGLTLNPMNFDTFQAVFDAEGFKPGDKLGDDLKLVTPAKVSLDESGSYQLVEKGKFVSLELYQQQSIEPTRTQQQQEPERPVQSEPEPQERTQPELEPQRLSQTETSPSPEPERKVEPIVSSTRPESEAAAQPEAEPITIEVNSGRVPEIPSESNGYDRSGVAPEILGKAIAESQSSSSQEPNVESNGYKPVEPSNKADESREADSTPLTFDDLKKSDVPVHFDERS